MRAVSFIGILICFFFAACKTAPGTRDQVLQEDRRIVHDPQRHVTEADRRAFEDAAALIERQKAAGVLDLDGLQDRFERVARNIPHVAEVWYNLGLIYQKQGNTEQAVQAYERALERKPALSKAAENLAGLYREQGQINDAVSALHRVLTVFPEDAGARAALADIYLAQGDLDSAVNLARETFTRDPENFLAHKVLMKVAIARDQESMARLLAGKIRALGIEDPEVYWDLAMLDLNNDDEDAAISNMQRASEISGDFLPSRLYLAEKAMGEEDWVTASRIYREILEYHPDRADIWLNLGVTYRGKGETKKAEDAYHRALEADPDESRAILNLGIIEFRVNMDTDASLEKFRRFAAMNPGLPRDHLVYSLMHEVEENIRMEEEMRRHEEEMRRAEEQARLEEERAAEEARIAEERAAEEARLEEERAAEEARLEEERAAEEARIEAEKEDDSEEKEEGEGDEKDDEEGEDNDEDVSESPGEV